MRVTDELPSDRSGETRTVGSVGGTQSSLLNHKKRIGTYQDVSISLDWSRLVLNVSIIRSLSGRESPQLDH